MATLVTRYWRKANQLQSVQWFEMQRTHKNIYKSKKQKKSLPWKHLLPGIIEKLISSNPYSGLECKEPQNGFLSPRNIKKCCHGNTCYRLLLKKQYRKSVAIATVVTKKLPKGLITTLLGPLAIKNILKILVKIYECFLIIKNPPT